MVYLTSLSHVTLNFTRFSHLERFYTGFLRVRIISLTTVYFPLSFGRRRNIFFCLAEPSNAFQLTTRKFFGIVYSSAMLLLLSMEQFVAFMANNDLLICTGMPFKTKSWHSLLLQNQSLDPLHNPFSLELTQAGVCENFMTLYGTRAG